ncbi:MAG: FtsX-like permease family protein [Spirochaetales bacterium]|nr:FtsX-like permease family protein [Spirochaetales bacterium]
MILPKIALRNLTRQKRRSILLGGALSFSMFILIVVNGLTGGLVENLQTNFADFVSGHLFFLQIDRSEENRVIELITDDAALMEAVDELGFEYNSLSRRTVGFASVIFSGGSASRQITGVDWDEEIRFAENLKLAAGDIGSMKGSDGIVVSVLLAETIGLLPKTKLTYAERARLKRDLRIEWKAAGQTYDLEKEVEKRVEEIEEQRRADQLAMIPSIIGEQLIVKLPTMYGQQTVGEYRVAAVYETQMDVSAYVDREGLNALMDMPAGSYNMFGLTLSDLGNLDGKTYMLHKALEDKYDLVPLAKVMRRSAQTVVDELKKEGFAGRKTIVTNLNNELGSMVSIMTGVQAGSFALFLVVLAVVMVGLVNTFRIVVYERTREIGTMRAVGMQRKQIRNLFLLEALFLAAAGVLPGILAGIGLLKILSIPRLDSFTELGLFLQNGHLTFTIDPVLTVSSLLAVFGFTAAAALLPARKAAKLAPAQALGARF